MTHVMMKRRKGFWKECGNLDCGNVFQICLRFLDDLKNLKVVRNRKYAGNVVFIIKNV